MNNIEQIQWTKGRLKLSAFVLFIQYLDYNSLQWRSLKKELSTTKLQLKVVKTRSIKKSLDGTPYGLLSQVFSGPMAIIFAKEEVPFSSLITAINLLMKKEKIQIIGGIYNNQVFFPSKLNELTNLPSQE